MKKCDYIVATSENDTLGRTILEAMSLGIPILANNTGGHKYIIRIVPMDIYLIQKTC